MTVSVSASMIGDNLDLEGLQREAKKMLERVEYALDTNLRIARSDDYKRGNREVAKLRAVEHKRDADVLRRLMEMAFA